MTVLTIICGVFQLAALAILTGCLVTLAALSHIVEWIFIIIYPAINFFLHQVNDLIVFLIILMARVTSCVVAKMFPCRDSNSSNDIVSPTIDELMHKDTDEGISFPDEQDLEEFHEESNDS